MLFTLHDCCNATSLPWSQPSLTASVLTNLGYDCLKLFMLHDFCNAPSLQCLHHSLAASVLTNLAMVASYLLAS